MKKNIFLIFAILCTVNLAAVEFSGTAGTGLSIIPDTGSPYVKLGLSSYFSGQIELLRNLFLKTNIGVQTVPEYFNQLQDAQPASFWLDEFSITYHTTLEKTEQQAAFGAFVNNVDAIGTNDFLSKNFGLAPITSPLQTSFTSYSAIPINSFGGVGGFFTTKLTPNLIMSIFGRGENESGEKWLSFDFRLGGVWDYATLDTNVSAQLHFADDDNNLLVIDKMALNAGVETALGQRDGTHLFLQAALIRGTISPSGNYSFFDLDALYCFLEPRFAIFSPKKGSPTSFNISLAGFILPLNYQIERLFFIKDHLGADVSFNINHFKGKDIDFGLHATATLSNPSFSDFVSSGFSGFNVYASPYANFKTSHGQFNTALRVNVLDIADIENSIDFYFGYKLIF